MGHVLLGQGSASLDGFGGLITIAGAVDLPETASPRNYDVDFFVGSVKSRAGLSSVYSYATTIAITSFILRYNLATFGYVGTEPTVNEGFLLNGFTGRLSYLNGLTVTVETVTSSTFTAILDLPNDGPYTNLSGSAVSTIGLFIGPKLGSLATSSTWLNPDNVLGDTGYSSSTSGTEDSFTEVPTAAANSTAGFPAWVGWSNATDILYQFPTMTAAGVTVYYILGQGSDPVSKYILADGMSFNTPSTATITGVSVSVGLYTEVAMGQPLGNLSLILGLTTNGDGIGTEVEIPVSPITGSFSTYTGGSPNYQWGTTLSPDIVNGAPFGVNVQVAMSTLQNGARQVLANQLSVSVYYTLSQGSGVLFVQAFSFSVPSTSGISGFTPTFQAYSSTDTTVSLQLLKAGLPVGTSKSVQLTTVPTVYSLGTSNDLWGDMWLYSDVNNTEFGVQVTSSGVGVTYINDLDMLVNITFALENFNYVKSYSQTDGDILTFALDASGIMWQEQVKENPDVLSVALTGISPNTFAKSATSDDQEYICFSDLTVGTDRPRVYREGVFYPLSQDGPGAPPAFTASTGAIGGVLNLTNYSLTSDVLTFAYTPSVVGFIPSVGSLYSLNIPTVPYLNGRSVVVLSTGLTSSQFEAQFIAANDTGGAIVGTATPTFSYGITSITQYAPETFGALLWSGGAGQTSPGSTVTIYYGLQSTGGQQDKDLLPTLYPVYVYLSGMTGATAQFNGTWLVNGNGQGNPPTVGGTYWYFTFLYTSSGYLATGFPHGSLPDYQVTVATLTTSTPIPDLSAGSPITITGVNPSGWDNNWTIADALTSAVLNIIGTQMSASGAATYTFNVASGTFNTSSDGQIVTVANCTNNAIFNATGVVQNVVGDTFQILGFPPQAIPFAVESEATAFTYGTQFLFDPGALTVGTTTDPIYGPGSGGNVYISGSSVQPLGSGTRQAVVFFITESGYETAVSPPVTFTTSAEASSLLVTNIPIGPSNVIARGIAITEAGQNGIPGANFYVIPNQVQFTVGNTVTTYPSTIVNDNISTTATFSFTDAVLLNSEEIDVQGNDLFNLVQLGSPAWCVPYASRMFYGMCLNKIYNFVNLSFDGGYLPNPGSNISPLGWTITDSLNTNLLNSPITGQALYINNTTGETGPVGLIYQTAYVDAYQVPIINNNILYSVRVAASNPSGNKVGTLVIDLTDFNSGIGFGTTYGSFSVPLSSMTSNMQVFSGTLLTTPFTKTVSPNLRLRVYVNNLGSTSDVLIDRIELYPTQAPYILASVFGSYVDDLEATDVSGTGGVIDTTSENPQTCFGGFVMHDSLYLMKQNSMYSTQDVPTSEPGGWGLHEVSNRVGTIGIHAYDTGEEWAVMACRPGIYGFNGGQPVPINWEIREIWEQINWDYGYTIVLRNDVTNKRMFCAVPLPTGTNPTTGEATGTIKWLPNSPYNPAPTSPNVMLMLNYQSLDSFDALISSPGMHTTMFGTLAAVDMKRKWTIWQIPTPYMDFITRKNGIDQPLFICNGIESSKIYQLEDNQYSDDGQAINALYTSYGFVNATKATTIPLFGLHAKNYTVFQTTVSGSGNMTIKLYPNILEARYPYTIPGGINLVDPCYDDYFRPLNIKGNRMFIEWSVNAAGSYMEVSKCLLSGVAHPHSPLNPTGGGPVGITTTQSTS